MPCPFLVPSRTQWDFFFLSNDLRFMFSPPTDFQTFQWPCFVWTFVLCGNPLTFSKAHSLLTLRYISTILYNRKSNFELYTKSFTLINLRIVMYVSFYFIFQIKSDYSFRFCLHDLYLCIGHAFHNRGGGAWGCLQGPGVPLTPSIFCFDRIKTFFLKWLYFPCYLFLFVDSGFLS